MPVFILAVVFSLVSFSGTILCSCVWHCFDAARSHAGRPVPVWVNAKPGLCHPDLLWCEHTDEWVQVGLAVKRVLFFWSHHCSALIFAWQTWKMKRKKGKIVWWKPKFEAAHNDILCYQENLCYLVMHLLLPHTLWFNHTASTQISNNLTSVQPL